MSLWQTIISWFDKSSILNVNAQIEGLTTEVYYKQLAIEACINLIANTVSRSEFRTYQKGKEVNSDNYYLFNVEPNPNKNSNKFWREVITRLVYDNECLVIQQRGYFYVAESFAVQRFAFRDYLFSDIVVDGLALKESKTSPEVFHFELHNEKIKNVIDNLYISYAKLIAASQKHYKKNNARRGLLDIPTSFSQKDDSQAKLNDLMQTRFKRFFESEGDAVLPITDGLKYQELGSNVTGTKGSLEGRDIRAFIDDVFDFVAIAFQVPPQLLKGNVADTDKAVNNFLTFCVNPLADLLTDEINRKYYGKKAYLERTYTKLDTTNIRAVDIKNVANALDVLVRIGAYCVDDCLRYLGMEPFNTDWSQARWMTKNYSPIEDALKGGD